jgi:hypothetical protein
MYYFTYIFTLIRVRNVTDTLPGRQKSELSEIKDMNEENNDPGNNPSRNFSLRIGR